MKDLEIYLQPLRLADFLEEIPENHFPNWGDALLINKEGEPFPNIDKSVEIAIVGIEEDRASLRNKGCGLAANQVRKYFYPLMPQDAKFKIADLGNIKQGQTIMDTYFAISEVVSILLQNNILPILVGGSNDVVLGTYMAYVNMAQIINILNVDSHFDLTSENDPVSDENYIHKLLCNDPNYLFDYTHIAYQSYFVDKKALEMLDNLRLEYKRLGEVQKSMETIEPMIRDADMVILDANSIRASDAPCSFSPHGLYGEEFCKIVNYAGMSDKLTSICFTGINPTRDIDGRTSHIIAHAIYYFIEGYMWRKRDFPQKDKSNYLRFEVLIDEGTDVVVFYKSKKSGRWWVEVPCSQESQYKYFNHYIVPCNYQDYQSAMEGEVPARWLIAYNKMNL